VGVDVTARAQFTYFVRIDHIAQDSSRRDAGAWMLGPALS
jgi:hypothetical protein